jgi:outer membrane protein assembly factor BamE (lipoprotein component of BamABCDE complex)
MGGLCLSCATTLQKQLDRLSVGMDKSEVLEVAGSPKSTARVKSEDQWTYIYYVGDTRMERTIKLLDGHVVAIAAARTVQPADAKQEEEILRQYEDIVKEKEGAGSASAKEKKSKFIEK